MFDQYYFGESESRKFTENSTTNKILDQKRSETNKKKKPRLRHYGSKKFYRKISKSSLLHRRTNLINSVPITLSTTQSNLNNNLFFSSRNTHQQNIHKTKVNLHDQIAKNDVPGARFYVTKLAENDNDFKIIKLAAEFSIYGTSRKKNFKLFRVVDMYETACCHGNRLLFHGTSVEGAVGILGSGFRNDVTAIHGRRHGNGTYLSPYCGIAQCFSEPSNGRNYVFAVEVAVPDDQFRENPESDNLPFSVYKSEYGVDRRFDLADSNGNMVSVKPLKRESCWSVASRGADEYVVRNQQFLLPRYLIKF